MSDIQNLSFEKIEGRKWKDEIPTSADSFVHRKVYELYSKKLTAFTPADLRFSISQGYYLNYLIPMALDVLKTDIFIETDFYQGSLLESVLEIDEHYWIQNPLQKEILENLILRDIGNLDSIHLTEEIKFNIQSLINKFTS